MRCIDPFSTFYGQKSGLVLGLKGMFVISTIFLYTVLRSHRKSWETQ